LQLLVGLQLLRLLLLFCHAWRSATANTAIKLLCAAVAVLQQCRGSRRASSVAGGRPASRPSLLHVLRLLLRCCCLVLLLLQPSCKLLLQQAPAELQQRKVIFTQKTAILQDSF
jgi:hypothetical protein